MKRQVPFAPTTLGEPVVERDSGWFGLTEARHRPDQVLAPHAHRYPAITMVQEGAFGLGIGRDTVECRTGGLFFKRGEHRHSNVIGRRGARSLILELRVDDAAPSRDLPLPRESFWTQNPGAVRLAREIRSEFGRRDSAAPRALEGLVLSLMAALLRAPRAEESRPPAWLGKVVACLRDSSPDPVGLDELAAVAGRHPAHVARTFRRHLGCTPGTYLRRLRLEHAARALESTDRPLAEIALEAGFYDQAHFGRSFRAWSGVSPGVFRRARR